MKTNMNPKVESALCYIPFVGWIAAIIFLIIEKTPAVRFNAAQSLVLSLGSWLLMFVMGVTIVLALLTPIVWLAVLIIDIVLAVKAYQGEKVMLPVLGAWAEMLLTKITMK